MPIPAEQFELFDQMTIHFFFKTNKMSSYTLFGFPPYSLDPRTQALKFIQFLFSFITKKKPFWRIQQSSSNIEKDGRITVYS